MNRILELFSRKEKRVIPFITAGYPNINSTVDLVFAAENAGASMIEIGMPFSDPQADGPIIQYANEVALGNGISIKEIFNQVKHIRLKSNIPIALMGYYNPILKMGTQKFTENCVDSGVDGLILPDLPFDEAGPFCKILKQNNICPILLVAPNTSNKRILKISKLADGLIYAVSILGITGDTVNDKTYLKKYLKRIRKHSSSPFIVGFGIKSNDDVIWFNKYSDGAVVGSAIIKELKTSKNPKNTIKLLIENLRREK